MGDRIYKFAIFRNFSIIFLIQNLNISRVESDSAKEKVIDIHLSEHLMKAGTFDTQKPEKSLRHTETGMTSDIYSSLSLLKNERLIDSQSLGFISV